MSRRVWTPEMDEILRAQYETTPVEDIKRSAGWDIDVKAITGRANRLGLRRMIGRQRQGFWNPARDKQLRELYPVMRTRDLMKTLGWTCSISSVHWRASALGITKRPPEIEQCMLKVQEHQGYRVLTHRMGG